MAYNIYNQPPQIGFSRTPILYLVGETVLFVEDSFQYIADVYLWQGTLLDKPGIPSYELRKPANTQFGNAVFDIKTLTTDYLVTPEFGIDEDPDNTTEMYVFAQIHFGYQYIDDVSGDTVIVKNVELSDTITVYNGYNYYDEGINYVPADNMGDAVNAYWMTDRPLQMNVPKDSSMYMFALNGTRTGSNITKIVVRVNDTTSSILTLADYDNYLVSVGCGYKEVLERYTPPETELLFWEIWAEDGSGEQKTQVYRYDVIDYCKYGFKSLQFLNRYGVWDNIICYGTQRESLEVNKEEIIHSPLEIHENNITFEPEFYFNKPFGQYHIANVSGRESLTLNTNWISEDWNPVLKQFMLTQYLYDADTKEPYTPNMGSLVFKTRINDKLINHTIKLKKAHTAIGTIG